jgi:hypothetical protein
MRFRNEEMQIPCAERVEGVVDGGEAETTCSRSCGLYEKAASGLVELLARRTDASGVKALILRRQPNTHFSLVAPTPT